MMESKDRVMSDEEIQAFMLKLYNSPQLLVRLIEVIRKISFKAGVKEVVEWMLLHTQHQYESFYQFDVEKAEWQAKLKEWELL